MMSPVILERVDEDGDRLRIKERPRHPDEVYVEVNEREGAYVPRAVLIAALTDGDKEAPETDEPAFDLEDADVDPEAVARIAIARGLIDPVGECRVTADDLITLADYIAA